MSNPAPVLWAGSKRRAEKLTQGLAAAFAHDAAAASSSAASSSSAEPAAVGLSLDALMDSLRKRARTLPASASASPLDLIPEVHSTAVQKLYRDVLESAFQFCEVNDLAALMKVNRQWCAAVVSMPSIRQPSRVREFNLDGLLRSRIARHVSAVPCIATSRLVILRLLSERMPWLEEFTGELPVFTAAASFRPLPPLLGRFQKMRRLSIVIPPHGSAASAIDWTAEVNRLLVVIGTLTKLESLSILMSSLPVSFAPLAALPHLRSFVFDWHSVGVMSDAQCAELRALPAVEHLWVPFKIFPRLLLQPETEPPLALNWQSIHADDDSIAVNDALALQLGTLSHLTALRVELQTSDCSFLLNMPMLRTLSLVRPNATISVDTSALLTSLVPCVCITNLSLQRLDFAAEHLCTLLARLPLLSSLRLQDMLLLTSLRCFATDALAASLLHLLLTNCPKAPLDEIHHLSGLRSLQSLTLRLHPTAPLGADRATELLLAMQARGSRLSRGAFAC